MRSYSIFITLFILTLTACKKDDKHSISSGTYVTKDEGTFVPATMYVQGAVITDQGIIQGYIYRHTASQTPSLANAITIDGSTATDNNAHLAYSITHQYDNHFLLTAHDSIAVIGSDAGTLGCENVHNRIRQNPPNYLCLSLPFNGSTYIRCTGQPKIPILANGNTIKIPLLKYFFSATRSIGTCGTSAILTDYFSSNSISDMETNDTLVVQTGYINLTKQ